MDAFSDREATALFTALTGLGGRTSSTPVLIFNLSAPRQFNISDQGTSQIVILEPTALSALDTERILVEPTSGQLTYLPGVQWVDRVPALVHARIFLSLIHI